MDVGDRIRERRTALEMTQLDLAQQLETDSMSVSRWERNAAFPRADTLVKIADALRVDVRWLITGEDGSATPVPAPTGTDG